MKYQLVLLLAICSWFRASQAVGKKCNEALDVGIGYNIINGNPQDSPDLGIKKKKKILQVTLTGKTKQTYCEALQVDIAPLSVCSYQEEVQFFTGTQSYRMELERNIRLTGNEDYGLAAFSFGGSHKYKEIATETSNNRTVFFDKEAYCYVSKIRYMTENLGKNHHQVHVTESFYNKFTGLGTKFSAAYYKFLNDWGTHIIIQATMGGRILDRNQSTLADLYKFAQQTSSTSIYASGAYKGFSASLNLDLSTLNSVTNSSTKFGRKKEQLRAGLTIKKINGNWTVQASDGKKPEPIHIVLITIDTVCESDSYWRGVGKRPPLSVTKAPLSIICDNLHKALKQYAGSLKVTNRPDNTTVALAWPDGTYGLPRARTGCPDQKGLSFSTGWRLHDTEDVHADNTWASELNVAGWFHRNDIKRDFCMKKKYKATDVYHIGGWPRGYYCIYKFRSCPPEFKEGWIFWDDEDHQNHNRVNRTVPDGIYNANTNISYCCRNDEPNGYTWPISLPNSNPFYLIRVGGFCQFVRGMNLRMEWIRWHDEFWANKDKRGGALYPDGGGGAGHQLIFYCYYYR